MFICLFPGSRVTTDQRVVAKQEIQEVESAKRAGAPYAHHRYQARDTNSFSARCQNREEHSPLDIHTAAFVHVLVLLAAGLTLYYGESINLT